MTARMLAAAATGALVMASAAGVAVADPDFGQWAQSYRDHTGIALGPYFAPTAASQALIVNSGAERKLALLTSGPAAVGGPSAAAVPIVHLAGVDTGRLRLSGPVLADIFLGNISYWDAPQVARLNPGIALPHVAIRVVHRSDSSPTSLAMTGFLESQSPAWREAVGAGDQVHWIAGVGVEGEAGMADVVRRIDNTIGYVDQGYAAQNGLASPQMIVMPGAPSTAPDYARPVTAPAPLGSPALTTGLAPAAISNATKGDGPKNPASLSGFVGKAPN